MYIGLAFTFNSMHIRREGYIQCKVLAMVGLVATRAILVLLYPSCHAASSWPLLNEGLETNIPKTQSNKSYYKKFKVDPFEI